MSVTKRDANVIRRNRIRDGFADVIDLYGVDEKEAKKLLDDVINNRREAVITKILDDINDQPLRPCRGGCGRMLKASNMDIAGSVMSGKSSQSTIVWTAGVRSQWSLTDARVVR